jgi:hypothetical protein
MGGKARRQPHRIPFTKRTDPNMRACLGCATFVATLPKKGPIWKGPIFCSEHCGYLFAIGQGGDDSYTALDYDYCTFCDWWFDVNVEDTCPNHHPEEESRLAANRVGLFNKS